LENATAASLDGDTPTEEERIEQRRSGGRLIGKLRSEFNATMMMISMMLTLKSTKIVRIKTIKLIVLK
jgi:hypothetical protein